MGRPPESVEAALEEAALVCCSDGDQAPVDRLLDERTALARRRCGAAACAAVAIVGGASALLSSRLPSRFATDRNAALVAEQAATVDAGVAALVNISIVPFLKQSNVGCSNYADILLSESYGETRDACNQKCLDDAECVGFGYQALADCVGRGVEQDGVCYLWKGKCKVEVNGCWDQFGPRRQTGVGCANFRDIQLGERTVGATALSCGVRCAEDDRCVGFGYQAHAACGGDSAAKDGTCYLWSGECESQPNPCWTQYGPATEVDSDPTFAEVVLGPLQWNAPAPGDADMPDNVKASDAFPMHEGIGCANIRDYQIGERTSGVSLEDCRSRCSHESSCVGFNYQTTAACDGDSAGKDGTCFILSDACSPEINKCWDHYGEIKDKDAAIMTTKPPPTPPPAPAPPPDMHGLVSLFCWVAMRLGTEDQPLVENQFDRQMGVFNPECNGRALLADGDFYREADGWRTIEAKNIGSMACQKIDGESWANTPVFQKAWQAVIDEGSWRRYDWVVKVDADCVFRPLRLKWHLDHNHMGLNPDERKYLKNFVDGYPVVGAIEVASHAAVEAMAQDPDGCNSMQMPAEDDWFHKCMEHHGAQQHDDSTLLCHQCYDDDKCSDQWYVALHPFKDVHNMNICDNAIR